MFIGWMGITLKSETTFLGSLIECKWNHERTLWISAFKLNVSGVKSNTNHYRVPTNHGGRSRKTAIDRREISFGEAVTEGKITP